MTKREKSLSYIIKIPEGYINLAEYGYSGKFTDYYANKEGKVLTIYYGTRISAKYQNILIHKRDKVPLVRLQKIGRSNTSYPVLISTIISLVTTGKSSIRGARYNYNTIKKDGK